MGRVATRLRPVALGLALFGAVAAPIRAEVGFPRHPAPSPGGTEIAFSWQGDIWVVAATGGEARRLTAHPGYDHRPVWSPDGQWIAFTSARRGNDDVFVMPLSGGEVRQLTFDTGPDTATDFTPDGTKVVFTSWRDLSELWMPSLYAVSVAGGTPVRVLDSVTDAAAVHDDGTITFEWGSRGGKWWRRGYRGAGRRSLWQRGPEESASPEPFYRTPAQVMFPSWSSALDAVVFLTEETGSYNVAMSRGGAAVEVLTRFAADGARFPRVARHAPLIAFEKDLTLWTVTPGAEPTPIEIIAPAGAPTEAEARISVGSMDEFAVSPDGKEIAFVFRGDIFIRRADPDAPEVVRLTQSPARDHDLTWAPDSKRLVFVSDRDQQRDLYGLTADDDTDSPRLLRAGRWDIERLTDSPEEEYDPQFSPDGERIAFIRGTGDLVTVDADGDDDTVLSRGFSLEEFAWSPDSRWIAFTRWDDDFNLDVKVIAADGGETVDSDGLVDVAVGDDGAVNVTRHPGSESNPTWSPDGRKLAFVGDRSFERASDIWYAWLRRADDEKTVREVLDESWWDDEKDDDDSDDDTKDDTEEIEVDIDFDEIHRRLRRVTRFPGDETEVALTGDGEWIVFVAQGDEGRDLWRVRWDGKEQTRLTEGGANPRRIVWHPESEHIYYLSNGVLNRVEDDGGKRETLKVSGRMTVDLAGERLQMFDEAWRVLNEGFYDPAFHGADWEATRDRYRPYAVAAGHRTDFHDAVRLMLGELNSSHQEFWEPSPDEPGVAVGRLGIVPEPLESGAVRVADVLPFSPAARVNSRLEVGDVIEAVDGVELQPTDNLYRLLQDRVEKPVRLTVDGREVVIRPYDRRSYRTGVWERDVRARRARVTELSGGRFGYINLRSMGSASADQFERELYAVAEGKEALVIDVRDNSGGWVTDILLHSLLAGDHAVTVPRNGGEGYPSPRRLIFAWTKPIVVLCNPSTFSNGEIFTWAIQTLGRGPLVGQPTFGGVISTGGRRLLDGSWVRRPFRGWYVKRGKMSATEMSNMDRQGCVPDVLVEITPDDYPRGRDPQLDRAIEVLRESVDGR